MILLQIDPKVTDSFITEWGAYGAILILLVIGIYFLVKYIKTRKGAEKDRLIKEKEEEKDKSTILYNEIKELNKTYNDNQTDLLLKSHEIQSKTVEALNKTTEALNNNTSIFNKLIDKL